MIDFLMVMSAPSLRATYLESTLRQLLDNGGQHVPNRYVCFDGDPCGMDDLANSLGFGTLEKEDGPSGTKSMIWWIFEHAIMLGADRLIFCEDDLFIAPNAINTIRLDYIPKGHGFITYYDYKEFPADAPYPGDGMHSVPAMGRDGRGLWGSLCLLISREVMQFVTSREYNAWRDPWPHKKTAGDCTLTWALTQSPYDKFAVRVPSLVDHAGFESSIDARRIRRSAFFAGQRQHPEVLPTSLPVPSVARPFVMHPNAAMMVPPVVSESPEHCHMPMRYDDVMQTVRCVVCGHEEDASL